MNKKIILLSVLLAVSQSALAHTGIGTGHSLMAGFVHPWQGIDHLLVLIGVGLWTNNLPAKTRHEMPAAFIVFLAIGVGISVIDVKILWADSVVALSVLCVGLLIAVNSTRVNPWLMTVAAVFALSHGYSHAEDVASVTHSATVKVEFLVGLLTGSVSLISIGFVAGKREAMKTKTLRLSFALISGTAGILQLAS